MLFNHRGIRLLILFLFLLASMHLTSGCKSYSIYPIDDKPLVKTDSNLLGIWKAVGDTDKLDYMLIQSRYDLYHHIDYIYHLDSSQLRAYYGEAIMSNPHIADQIIYHKDPSDLNMAYQDFLLSKDHYYYITRVDNHGQNPHYQQWGSYASEVNNNIFLNIPYRDNPVDKNGDFIKDGQTSGYFFLRIVNINASYDTLTTAVVADKTLKDITKSKDVRDRIAKNVSNPSFYSDTLRFYKVSGYHLSLGKSRQQANR